MEEKTALSKVVKRSGVLNIDKYQNRSGGTLVERIAHYLNWAAEAYPKQFTPHHFVVKAIHGYERAPAPGSDQVKSLKGALQRVKKVLRESYGRELDSQIGYGIRATVDSTDVLTVALPKKMRRLSSAKTGVQETAALIDRSKVVSNAETAPYLKWYDRDITQVLKTIGSPDFEKRLQIPATTE